jgi:hypothetical protein
VILIVEKQDGLGVHCTVDERNAHYSGRMLTWVEYRAAMNEPQPVKSNTERVETQNPKPKRKSW